MTGPGWYGANGYVIGGWNAATSDLVGLPAGVTYAVEQGAPLQLTGSQFAGNIRALESPNQTDGKASGGNHATQTRVRLNFTNAYSGTLHLYALDHWLQPGRRENVTIDDGAGPRIKSFHRLFQRRLNGTPRSASWWAAR